MLYAAQVGLSPEQVEGLERVVHDRRVVVVPMETYPVPVPGTISCIACPVLAGFVFFVRQHQDVCPAYEVAYMVTNKKRFATKEARSSGGFVTRGKWVRSVASDVELLQAFVAQQESKGRAPMRVFWVYEMDPSLGLVVSLQPKAAPEYTVVDTREVLPGWYMEVLAGDVSGYDALVEEPHNFFSQKKCSYPPDLPRRYMRGDDEKIYAMVKVR